MLLEENLIKLKKCYEESQGSLFLLPISDEIYKKTAITLSTLENLLQPEEVEVSVNNGFLLRWVSNGVIVDLELTDENNVIDIYNNGRNHISKPIYSIKELKEILSSL